MKAPSLLEVGGVKSKGKLPNRFAGTEKVPKVGSNGCTSSVLHDIIIIKKLNKNRG